MARAHGRCVRLSQCCCASSADGRSSPGALPFDRHDWYVDRCGKEVRYVIDFYFDERRAGSPDAFTVDARPALDDFGSLRDRAKMGVRACDAHTSAAHALSAVAGLRVVPAPRAAVPVQRCAVAHGAETRLRRYACKLRTPGSFATRLRQFHAQPRGRSYRSPNRIVR